MTIRLGPAPPANHPAAPATQPAMPQAVGFENSAKVIRNLTLARFKANFARELSLIQ
jgi:hypothetical protein